MATRDKPQLGFDEVIVDAPELEADLEERAKRKASLDAVRLKFDEVDTKVKGGIEKLELDESPVRIGRWRITKSTISGGPVSYETKARDQIRIRDVSEDD